MIIATSTKTGASLDMELCRAMYEKDPDKMIELVSKWLEVNRLETSDRFCIPEYLSDVLSRTGGPTGNWRRTLAS
ncbi:MULTISPECIES: hypothetical protein [unclassified Roseibium]|uniref:hypothetical protein n=1 Tax=unclassified Roseibium TaxID=2629323 RepID=UPI003170E02F